MLGNIVNFWKPYYRRRLLLRAIWELRSDLRSHLNSFTAFRYWMKLYGENEYPLFFDLKILTNHRIKPFNKTIFAFRPCFVRELIKIRPDIIAASSEYAKRTQVVNDWCLTHLQSELGLSFFGPKHFWIRNAIRDSKITTYQNTIQPISRDFRRLISSDQGKAGKVLVIGSPNGLHGIGNDALDFVNYLDKIGFTVYLDELMHEGSVVSQELSCTPWNGEQVDFAVLFTSPLDSLQVLLSDLRCRFNLVCYWPWEFPRLPKRLRILSALPDQIVAVSDFSKNSFDHFSLRNTEVFEAPIDVSFTEGAVRDDFGISSDSFVCFIMADGNSSLLRKGVFEGIRAFQEAFSSTYSEPKLYVKTINLNPSQTLQIDQICEMDSRVTHLNEAWSRGRVLDFIRACDLHIALHRCEGFGRVIRECLMLNKKVLATRYSGSSEFTNHPNFTSVNYKLHKVNEGEYPFSKGLKWAKPNLHDAASKLHKIFDQSAVVN
jgi:hypothetical protein